MFDDLGSLERYELFVLRVVRSGEVWALEGERGWCVAPSVEDDSDPETGVMPFWSERAWARRCAQERWSRYRPRPIPLHAFLSEWLPAMARDGLRAGTDWSSELFGLEIEPMRLKEEVELRLAEAH